MLKKAALATGIVFLLIGILGFVPGITTSDTHLLLGIFRVDAAHNLVHIISGIAFLAASSRNDYSSLLFKIMGIVYALVTVLGFLVGSGNAILGLIHVNTADNFLHLVLAVAFLYFGFGVPAAETNNTTVRV